MREKESQAVKCFECNGIHKECPNYIKSKGKAMNVTLSDSESSSSDEESDGQGNFTNFTIKRIWMVKVLWLKMRLFV
jgi:hypothetical protein